MLCWFDCEFAVWVSFCYAFGFGYGCWGVEEFGCDASQYSADEVAIGFSSSASQLALEQAVYSHDYLEWARLEFDYL